MLAQVFSCMFVFGWVQSSVQKISDTPLQAKLDDKDEVHIQSEGCNYAFIFARYKAGGKVVAHTLTAYLEGSLPYSISNLIKKYLPMEDLKSDVIRSLQNRGRKEFFNENRWSKVSQTILTRKWLGYGEIFFEGTEPENLEFDPPVHINRVTLIKRVMYQNKYGNILASIAPAADKIKRLGWQFTVATDFSMNENYSPKTAESFFEHYSGSKNLTPALAEKVGEMLLDRREWTNEASIFVPLDGRNLRQEASFASENPFNGKKIV